MTTHTEAEAPLYARYSAAYDEYVQLPHTAATPEAGSAKADRLVAEMAEVVKLIEALHEQWHKEEAAEARIASAKALTPPVLPPPRPKRLRTPLMSRHPFLAR